MGGLDCLVLVWRGIVCVVWFFWGRSHPLSLSLALSSHTCAITYTHTKPKKKQYLEHLAKKRTSTALTKLMDLAPKTALLLTPTAAASSSSSSAAAAAAGVAGGAYEEEMIPVELVQTGDLLKVR